MIDGVDGGAHGSDRRVLMRGQEPELGAVVKVQKRDKHSKKGKDFAKSPKEKRSSKKEKVEKKEKKEAGHAGSAAEAKQAATGDDKRRSTSPQKLLSRVVSFNARDEKTKDPAERPELARQTSAVRAHTDHASITRRHPYSTHLLEPLFTLSHVPHYLLPRAHAHPP